VVVLWLAVFRLFWSFAENWNVSGRVTHLLRKQKLVSESTSKRGSFFVTIGTTKHPATSSPSVNTVERTTGRPTNGDCVTIFNNKHVRTVTVRVWLLRDDRIVVEAAIHTLHTEYHYLVERLNFCVTFTFHVSNTCRDQISELVSVSK